VRYNCGQGYARIKSQYLRQGVHEKAFRDRGSGFVVMQYRRKNIL